MNHCVISPAFPAFVLRGPGGAAPRQALPAAPIVDDVLTGCLLGGVISGVGSGLALTSGCCGGGLDLLGLCLSKKGVQTTIGQFNLFFNVALLAACGLMFDVPTLIYSVLNVVITSIAIDRSHRQSVTVQVLIFTKSTEEHGVGRGADKGVAEELPAQQAVGHDEKGDVEGVEDEPREVEGRRGQAEKVLAIQSLI